MSRPRAGAEPSVKSPRGSGPVVFIGAPSDCRAAVAVRNESDRRVKLRHLVVQVPELAPAQAELRSRVRGRLEPRRETTCRARLQLDPTTPPGTYAATVRSGEGETEAEIRILESPRGRMTPRRLELRGRSGETLERSVLCENRGNVPFELPSATRVAVEEQSWLGGAAVTTLRSFEGEGLQELMDAVVRRATETLPGPLEIRIEHDGETECSPGESRVLRLRLTLPEDLRLGRRYRGALDVGPARLRLLIECTAQLPVTADTDAGRGRAKARSGKTGNTKAKPSEKKSPRKKPTGKKSSSTKKGNPS